MGAIASKINKRYKIIRSMMMMMRSLPVELMRERRRTMLILMCLVIMGKLLQVHPKL